MCVDSRVCYCLTLCVFTVNVALSGVISIICVAALESESWLTLLLNDASVYLSVFSLCLCLAILLKASQSVNRLAAYIQWCFTDRTCVYVSWQGALALG